jgi:uncharacterized protein YndB with AHSA1/START domain
MNASVNKPKFVYVVYIAATSEKVWQALTDAKLSERYWEGARVESDRKVGSPFALKLKRTDKDIVGTVLEADPPRRLAFTFQPRQIGRAHEAPSRVSFDIEPHQDQVKLTVTHDGFEPGSRVFEEISGGWPFVLSNLKGFTETGRVLSYQDSACAVETAAS